MPARRPLPFSQKWLSERLSYDRELGELRWKERPRTDFKTRQGWRVWTTRCAGRSAARMSESDKFPRVIIDGVKYFSHHLIWFLVYGEDPPGPLYHLNGVPYDNRLENLSVTPPKREREAQPPFAPTKDLGGRYQLPSQEFLQQRFEYRSEEGALIWKGRPREDFASVREYRIFETRWKNRMAGTVPKSSSSGSLVKIYGQGFWAHRLIFKLVTGRDPRGRIRHLNGNRADNRWENLAEE